MNIEHLKLLSQANRESQFQDRFDMEQYAHDCGTPACGFGNFCASGLDPQFEQERDLFQFSPMCEQSQLAQI